MNKADKTKRNSTLTAIICATIIIGSLAAISMLTGCENVRGQWDSFKNDVQRM